MHQVDRWVGTGIAALAVAVLWSSSSFPNVPGQKLGASTLPLIIGAALLLCGLLLVLRSWSAARYAAPAAPAIHNPLLPDLPAPDESAERIAPALGILAAIALYIVAADTLGYLLVAPVSLLIAQVSLRVKWLPAIGWSLLATAVVHLAFYKLLKVPLPWGLVPVLY
jgi:putative tricarboxylic transport membrane protein